ncbi:hypothetical protein CDEST_15451 [Colletotrichum destructivum]|uniref:Uncharacterized protein n=1 Tax=Colletotrichum destructivum TaxID=34406 RepID=A0AAX4J570_9PEZI|nr:hypothetical protein CDEST_15451 [Colletotrichum destructivum]
MKWSALVSISAFTTFPVIYALADGAEEECWRGPAMKLGALEFFETPEDAAACPEAHIYFLGQQSEVLLSRHVNITNSSDACDSNMLQAISLPADLAGTYAKVTFLCGNVDGPSCQMIRLLPPDGSQSAAPLSLAMARTCLDSSTATAAYPSSGATSTTGGPWDGTPSTAVTSLPTSGTEDASAFPIPSVETQPPSSYFSTGAETEGSGITGPETEGSGIPSSLLGSDLESVQATSTTANASLDPSETNVDPTTLVENTGGATGSVPFDVPSEVPSDASSGPPDATTLITSTVAGITNAPRCTCEPS